MWIRRLTKAAKIWTPRKLSTICMQYSWLLWSTCLICEIMGWGLFDGEVVCIQVGKFWCVIICWDCYCCLYWHYGDSWARWGILLLLLVDDYISWYVTIFIHGNISIVWCDNYSCIFLELPLFHELLNILLGQVLLGCGERYDGPYLKRTMMKMVSIVTLYSEHGSCTNKQ